MPIEHKQWYVPKFEVVSFEDWLAWRGRTSLPLSRLRLRETSLRECEMDSFVGTQVLESGRKTEATFAEYELKVWEDPQRWVLNRFDEEIVGFFFLPRNTRHVYLSTKIPRKLRKRAWVALDNLFFDFFEPLAPDHPVEYRKGMFGLELLRSSCGLWWDVPFAHYNRWDYGDRAFLAHCAKCLDSPKPSLQQSAIRGLGRCLFLERILKGARDVLLEYIERGEADESLIRDAEWAVKHGEPW